uniref:NADH-ubiquinone oxidoreductase chain 6 n=1 Tax=Magnusiomyces tetraspermus TaxID=1232584 RepID=A0A023UMV0_9ASCO|nr:NADH dehydrogenase subunit 6 [Magnusiomyces tetraspermus]AHY04935.1 NADH dehydrogenase subunit 6 [Magnusiomyces tetraspermus]
MFLIETFNTPTETNNSTIVVFEYTSVITATCVVFSRNAVVSIIYTITTYVNVSIYTFYTGTGVTGTVYITVYVGAIAITFTFITSTINIKISEMAITSNKQDVVTIVVSTTTIGFVTVSASVEDVKVYGDITSYINGTSNVDYSAADISDQIEVFNVIRGDQATGADTRTYSETKVVGETTFTQYSVTTTITGIITTTTIIGVIIITK